MGAINTTETPIEGKRGLWSRRFAIGFCVSASILGWAAVAGLFIGVWSTDGTQLANEKGVEALSDIAPGAGPSNDRVSPTKP
jgi:hypothetical protein